MQHPPQPEGTPAQLTQAAGDVCAMKITPFAWLTKRVTQGSPFPCDNNTITIELRPNVPVRLDCAPSFTLYGFGKVEAPGPGNLTLTDVDSSGAVGAGVGFGHVRRVEWAGHRRWRRPNHG